MILFIRDSLYILLGLFVIVASFSAKYYFVGSLFLVFLLLFIFIRFKECRSEIQYEMNKINEDVNLLNKSPAKFYNTHKFKIWVRTLLILFLLFTISPYILWSKYGINYQTNPHLYPLLVFSLFSGVIGLLSISAIYLYVSIGHILISIKTICISFFELISLVRNKNPDNTFNDEWQKSMLDEAENIMNNDSLSEDERDELLLEWSQEIDERKAALKDN